MTERIGAYRTRYAGEKTTTAGGVNLIVDNVVMEHGGWVTSIGMKYASDGGTAESRPTRARAGCRGTLALVA